MRKPWVVMLTTNQISALNHVKSFYIENSRLPSGKELADSIGVTKGAGERFMLIFSEVGILKKESPRKYRWARTPYQIQDCGRFFPR